MFVRDGIAYAGEPKKDLAITEARVVNDLSMLVSFSNGETRLFDASHLIEMPAFEPLHEQSVFKDFTVDHGVICWLDGQIDIAPETVYEDSYEYDCGQLQVA